MKLGELARAAFAGAVAGVGDLETTLVGPERIGQITAGQWLSVASATLIAAGGVYGLGLYGQAKAGAQ